jgi:fructoselysine-6-P-deglycase FrlB-like protein
MKEIHVFRSRYGQTIEIQGSLDWARKRAATLGMIQHVETKIKKNENRFK